MTKHTQGPFRIQVNPEYMNADIYGKGRKHIATVWASERKNPTIEQVAANAKLLGNADQMLALLKEFIRADYDSPDAMRDALEEARRLVEEIEQ